MILAWTLLLLGAALAYAIKRGLRSIAIDFHGWSGFSFGADLVDHVAVLGFLTVWCSKHRLRDLLEALRPQKPPATDSSIAEVSAAPAADKNGDRA